METRKEREEQIIFCQSMKKVVPKLKKEIEKKETILIPVKDLAKEMEFDIKDISWFYHRTKLCLRDSGIHAEPKRKDHKPALLMRTRTPEDVW